ncbi:MAG: 16S rRNA (cytidine(1402)-2'-O)-methyltransferase, partial [Coriobacteriia bacterium]|nr:16S rRNA (cytidine(1402)-2'-O)-methyltransferase [Coriobacteriia bacterium]
NTGDLAAQIASRELKGEVVLLVGPPVTAGPDVTDDEIRRLLGQARSRGLTKKDAVREVAETTGLARNRVYGIAHAGTDS